jgi:phosphopantothenoylcysteine synthetase/decarboxylase
VTINPTHKKGIRRGSRHIQVQTEDDGELFMKKEDPIDQTSSFDLQVTAAAVAEKKVQQYEEQQQNKDRCNLCCRPFNQKHLNRRRDRRTSCPAVLASGAKIKLLGHEAGVLLALIDQLKQQLVEEQQSRKLLEKAIQSQWLEKTKTFV